MADSRSRPLDEQKIMGRSDLEGQMAEELGLAGSKSITREEEVSIGTVVSCVGSLRAR